jgi:alpha-ketoglutarate-dependent taurine dioxygenase
MNISEDHSRALKLLNVAISKATVSCFQLKGGDSLVLDNRRMLHGRTKFVDVPHRLLLRVRANKE